MDLNKFSRLIMIEQTLFALPFAYIGVLFAGGGTFLTWIFVSIALFAARTAGMSFNRVIDAGIDSRNPRTKERLVPKGEVEPKIVWLIAVCSSCIFIGVSYMINTLCFYLSFPAVFMLLTYSYFKRFSSSSHLYLGLIEAAAPIGGYLAVTGEFSLVPFILGFVILAWIAGFDIVYALQDMEFDIKENLYSIPSIFGKKRALLISAFLYILSISALILAGVLTYKKTPYWICVTCIAIIFIYQQKLARSGCLNSEIGKFFSINKYVAPLLLTGALIELVY